MRERIKSIVFDEFSKVVRNIESDFRYNFIRKRYNFLLSQLDEEMTANMVFVSSFESKSGFAISYLNDRIMCPIDKISIDKYITAQTPKSKWFINPAIITHTSKETAITKKFTNIFSIANLSKPCGLIFWI